MNNCDCVNCTAARALSASNVLIMTIKLNCQSAIEAELALCLALADLLVGNPESLDVEECVERFRQLVKDTQQHKAEEKIESVNAVGGVG